MKVLCDYVGHPDLFYSMYALFEKRLGWKLYRPDANAKDWREKYGVKTAKGKMDSFVSGLHNGVECFNRREEGILCRDIGYPYLYTQRLITPDQFHAMDFDVICSTSFVNETPLFKFMRQYKPDAIFVRQIANTKETPKVCKNVLRGTLEPMPAGTNFITYCPEHPPTFSPAPPKGKIIKSFGHYLSSIPQDLSFWQKLGKSLDDFEFKMHGHLGTDHYIARKDMPIATQECMFVFHLKAGSCGYIPRQSLTCGKPLIVRKDYAYIGNRLAINYLKDGVNCIDVSSKKRSFRENIRLIREWSKPDVYRERSRIARKSFEEIVDFVKEARKIAKWFESLEPGV